MLALKRNRLQQVFNKLSEMDHLQRLYIDQAIASVISQDYVAALKLLKQGKWKFRNIKLTMA